MQTYKTFDPSAPGAGVSGPPPTVDARARDVSATPLTLYRSVKDNKGQGAVTLGEVATGTATGLWPQGDKQNTPAVTPAGTFTRRSADAAEEYSHIACIDLDKIPEARIPGIKRQLEGHPSVSLAHRSVSGTGMAAWVYHDAGPEHHAAAYRHAVKELGLEEYADMACHDLPRLRILANDPERYWNPTPTPLHIPVEVEAHQVEASPDPVPDPDPDPVAAEALRMALGTPVAPSDDPMRVLLEAVEERDIAAEAGHPTRLTAEHYTVATLRGLKDAAERTGHRLGVRNGEPFIYTGRHWQRQEHDPLLRHLRQAALQVGVPSMKSESHRFMDGLHAQFLAAADPIPEAGHDRVLVNLRNGTLEIERDGGVFLRPHSPDDGLDYVLPYNFSKDATCPKFTAHLERVLPDPEVRKVTQEVFAFFLLPPGAVHTEKMPVFYGPGSNGKSVVAHQAQELFGKQNCTALDMAELAGSEYARALLTTAKLNICTDITARAGAVAMIKRIASREPITARWPYGPPFTTDNYAPSLFLANELPRDGEASHGWMRRLLIVPFEERISREERDDQLKFKIAEAELPGILLWALEGAQRLLAQRGYSRCAAIDRAAQQYRGQIDNVSAFVDAEGLAPSTTTRVPLREAYGRYKAWCEESGHRACRDNEFGRRMKALGIDQTNVNGRSHLFVDGLNTTDHGTAPF